MLLLTSVPFYCPWNFGGTLLWDQTGTSYSLSAERGGAVWKPLPTTGGPGRCDSGNSDLHRVPPAPQLGQLSGGLLRDSEQKGDGLAWDFFPSWPRMDPQGSLRGEGNTLQPVCVYPATLIQETGYLLWDHEALGSVWSPVKQDALFVVTIILCQDSGQVLQLHTAWERLSWEKGRIPGWGYQGKRAQEASVLQATPPRGSWWGLRWTFCVGLPSCGSWR